jgi:1-acyl-sn-glycerol-3-phosphate acyltransferase
VSRLDLALVRDDARPARELSFPAAAIAAGSALTTRATRLARLLSVGLHIARGVAIAAFVFPLTGREGRRAHVQRWARQLLDILAVSLKVSGTRPCSTGTPLMLVANHVSWLDVVAINAVLPVRYVAKSEVRAWPVIGWLSEKAGTLFIQRARRRDILRVNEELAQTLRGGYPVAVFPEATTTDGTTVLKFHAPLLQPAVLARATLRPVAMRYASADGTLCLEAAFVANISLWDSLELIVTQREIVAEIAFLPALDSAGRHRRELAPAAREAILRSLCPPSRDSRN